VNKRNWEPPPQGHRRKLARHHHATTEAWQERTPHQQPISPRLPAPTDLGCGGRWARKEHDPPTLAQARGGQIWAALPIAPPRTLLVGPGCSAVTDQCTFVAAPASATFDLHESANRRAHAAKQRPRQGSRRCHEHAITMSPS
jgi:hypothetical protein